MSDSDVSQLRKQFLGIDDGPRGPINISILGGTLNLNPPVNKCCAHDRCSKCNGCGIKKSGEVCVHFISCTCKKCRKIS